MSVCITTFGGWDSSLRYSDDQRGGCKFMRRIKEQGGSDDKARPPSSA